MKRSAKILCLPLLLPVSVALAQPGASNAIPRVETTIIYKLVDESGRVTYSNAPIKGGARVDLEPITVIPSTPSGSLNAANAQAVVPSANIKASAMAAAPQLASVKAPIGVATVLPVSSQSRLPAAAPAQAQTHAPAVEPPKMVLASVDSMSRITEQRQAETKRRILEGDLQTEENLLSASKSKLDEERQLSNGIRAMRASFAATTESVTPQKPLMTPETRAEIERHFERVRNLQDEVAMHENNLNGLRDKLAALK
ncbi:MAG: hypothetical protein ABI905_12875 [Betaproteobacteria bacterium]